MKTLVLLLTQLASHYYRPDFTPAQAQALLTDLADDLAEFTIFDVENAIRDYRRDPAERFFPTSGKLRALAAQSRRERINSTSKPLPVSRDLRPLMWWLQPKRFWKSHWSADDIPPNERAGYDRWLNRVKAGAVEGKDPNDYQAENGNERR